MNATEPQRDCRHPKAHSLQPSSHYQPSGWRVSKVSATSDTLYLYGPGGQLLSACAVVNGVRGTCSEPVYFAGRLLYDGQGNRVLADRLGTVRAAGGVARNYYPFGEEIGTPSANNTYKFASTYRDSATGLDYAVNRYYASGMGRFLSADPYQASGGPAVPQNWNRYAYVHNDPINYFDPLGTNEADPNAPAQQPGGANPFGVWGYYTALGGGGEYQIIGQTIVGGTSSGPGPSPSGSTGGGGPDYRGIVNGAVQGAMNALADPKRQGCRDLFGISSGNPSAAQVLNSLSSARPGDGSGAAPYGWMTSAALPPNSNGSVDVAQTGRAGYLDTRVVITFNTNPAGGFFTETGWQNDARIGVENQAMYRSLTVLHELQHAVYMLGLGRPPNPDSPSNDENLVQQCLK